MACPRLYTSGAQSSEVGLWQRCPKWRRGPSRHRLLAQQSYQQSEQGRGDSMKRSLILLGLLATASTTVWAQQGGSQTEAQRAAAAARQAQLAIEAKTPKLTV